MKYRRLGRTNLQVSEIALGTVELGLDYGIPVEGESLRPSEAEAARLLNQALDWGINFIDTARAYGDSEAIIGRALKARRREYILASKFKLGHWADETLGSEALRERVSASVEASLRALETDVIDLMQIHCPPVEAIRRGELLDILQDFRKAGHLRFLGVSTDGEAASLAVLEDGRYDSIQIAYNLLDRRPEERVLPLARDKDVGVVVRSVLLKGVLTHRYRYLPDQLAELQSAAEHMNSFAASETESLPELAYRYVLGHPAVSTALVGTGRLQELEAVIGYAARGSISKELGARIRSVVVEDQDQLSPSTWPLP